VSNTVLHSSRLVLMKVYEFLLGQLPYNKLMETTLELDQLTSNPNGWEHCIKLEIWWVNLRVFELWRPSFKSSGSSWGFCEVSPYFSNLSFSFSQFILRRRWRSPKNAAIVGGRKNLRLKVVEIRRRWFFRMS
jgi:hypothetical protein